MGAVLAVLYPVPSLALSNTAYNTVSVNGNVSAIALGADGTTYLGGTFTQAGPYVGMGVPLSPSTGLPVSVFPIVNGQINAVAPDGSGGRYIGGSFTRVGSFDRNNLAHIFADGTVDAAWNPNANGTVSAIAVSGATVYVGGAFTTIGVVTRNRLAAIGSDGTLQAWNPNASNNVNAIAVSGATIYVGGTFTTIGVVTRNRLAAIGTDGTLQAWNPNASNNVNAIAVSGTTIYAGGIFSTIGGVTRNLLAAIDAGSASATAWNPNVNSNVNAIAVSGTTIYVGGTFTTIGGVTRNRLAAIDATSASATAWNPNVNSNVNAIALSGTTIYAGGIFATIGGVTRNNIAAIDAGSASATAWDPNAGGSVNAIDISNSNVYIGGLMILIGGTTRNRLAAIGTDGTLQSWNPSANNNVNAIAVSGTTIYVGGTFTTIGGVTRNRLAAINAVSASATAWNPNVGLNTVSAIAVSGTNVYVGGDFTTIGALTRNRLAAIDAASATATAWNPNSNGTVSAIVVSGTTVYVGGVFTSMGGITRNSIAAIGTNGTLQSWNPNVTSNVGAIAVSGTTIYAGGLITAVGGVSRNRLVGIDAGSASATAWNPVLNSNVNAIAVSGTTIYAGGLFVTAGGVTRNRLAAIDAASASATAWDPNANSTVNALAVSGANLYVGGLFTRLGSSNVSGFAEFDLLAPVITITAPTLVSSSTITNTTIHVTDNNTLNASNVVVDPSTTAGTSGFNCTQTGASIVDCTILITSSGTLVIDATDDSNDTGTQSQNGYLVDITPPAITITAPTLVSSSTITDTTIHVTDDNAFTASNVVVDPSTTAGTSGFNCTQTGAAIVDCTIQITSSGSLVIRATDNVGNSATQTESGYVVDVTPPVIVIFAPTTSSTTDIPDTTIHVTDNDAIFAADVLVDASTTAGTNNFICTQTNAQTVDCTIVISSSGDLVINATDRAGNTATLAQNGYIVNRIGPTIIITTPTRVAHATISDTTIHVTSLANIAASSVIIDPATTASTANLQCVQTDPKTVDCTLDITSSGDLVVTATDSATNSTTETASGYVIETVPPTITITAPQKLSNTAITNTTIHVTDNYGISATDVIVDGGSTANTSSFVCTQTDGTTVDCTITVDDSGDLLISATDLAGNSASQAETGYVIVTQAPVISNIASVPTETGATITWTTDSLSSSKVTYGPDTPYTTSTAELDTSPRVTSHTVVLSNLAPCSTYHYAVQSTDAFANTATSADNTFTTSGCATPILPSGGGGNPMPPSGVIPPTGPFSVTLQGGGSDTAVTVVTLELSASSDVNRMAISRFADFHDAGIIPFARSVQWSICGASICTPGTYDVYVKFYQAYGVASPVQHLAIIYMPVFIGTIDSDKGLPISSSTNLNCHDGNLLRGTLSAVYYCANDGKRYLFPNEKTFFTWYANFQGVLRIDNKTLGGIPLGSDVTYRPGVRLLKLQSNPRVYEVFQGGELRWVSSEAVAKALFGPSWNQMIDDLPEAFFVDYKVGPPITLP
ncbi:MAG: fibronectin type III domain-containing protein [Patescibacteria group bacterium]